MVGEYGSGKKPGVRSTAKSAESVKKDGKMPKADKQDAPYGLKDEVKGKYKSSGMEPTKKVPGSLNEGYDVFTLNPESYFQAMDNNGELIKKVRDAIKGDDAKKKHVIDKLKKHAEQSRNVERLKDKVKKAIKNINDATPMRESKGIPSEQLIKLKQLVFKLNENLKLDFDTNDFNPVAYLNALSMGDKDYVKMVHQAANNDLSIRFNIIRKLKKYAENYDGSDKNQIKNNIRNIIKSFNPDSYFEKLSYNVVESKGISPQQLTKLKQLVSKLEEEGKKDLASALKRLLDKGVEEGMDYTISNQETADKPGPGFYNQGTLSGFEEDINEDVNVKDSRKIKLTPTTKNQILTLVHEIARGIVSVKPGDMNTLRNLTNQGFNAKFDNPNDPND
jgi:hypothetical protein